MRKKVNRIATLLFHRRTWAVLLFQAALILISLVSAWLLRFDFKWADLSILAGFFLILIVCRLSAIRFYGLHHGWWRYAGVSDALDITKAVASGSILFLLAVCLLSGPSAIPLSIYISEAIFTATLLMGVRLLSRAFAESVRADWSSAKPVIIIGAGFAAQMLLRELRTPGSGYMPLGCVDDDASKKGLKVLGTPVLGTVAQLPDLAQRLGISEVLIAIPSADSSQMRRFVEICERAQVKFRTVPALRDFLLDRATLSQVREVNLEDLLGREPIKIDLDFVRLQIEDRVLMVTGAAGSIGSEICRQILSFNPAKLVCLDQNETGMFYLNSELVKLRGRTELVMAVADVQDPASLRHVMKNHDVEVIFHAAAYKHVPMMECNVEEAVKNNVFALLSILEVARETGCDSLILISSDKAVNPTSIMGATKRICELILASRPDTPMRCVSVRFGNVLGSSGSLIPVLQEQIRNSQPLTITDPEIRRFFMTTQEAVSLVLQAFAIGHHRDILVLDMGPSIRVLDLARTLIRLSGKSEHEVNITFTGLREGEKFYEELFYQSEEILPSSFSKIKRTAGYISDWSVMQRGLRDLRLAVEAGDANEIRNSIHRILPEYVYTPNYKTTSTVVADVISRASGQ